MQLIIFIDFMSQTFMLGLFKMYFLVFFDFIAQLTQGNMDILFILSLYFVIRDLFGVKLFLSVVLRRTMQVSLLLIYLVEAKEVLDGGGRVEDVAFSRHHQHKAVQRLKTKERSSF